MNTDLLPDDAFDACKCGRFYFTEIGRCDHCREFVCYECREGHVCEDDDA